MTVPVRCSETREQSFIKVIRRSPEHRRERFLAWRDRTQFRYDTSPSTLNCGVSDSLLEVLFFQKRILLKDIFAVRICRKKF